MAKSKRYVGSGGAARIGRSIVRNASKITEKQMISQADKLYENPFLVLPTCQDDVCKKRLKKIEKEIEKVVKVKDDTKKLEKIASKKSLASAVAGTLLIHHAQKAPFLAAAPIPSGTVLFAQRGNASRDHLIAVQHFDDPFFRLLGIREIILKHDLYVYSWDDSFICSSSADPPKDFINFVMKKHKLTYKETIAHCPHVSSEDIKNKHVGNNPYLLVNWKSADCLIGICKQCASDKTNFIYEVTKYLIEPDIEDDFTIEIIGRVIKDQKRENTIDTSFLNDYYAGKLSDKQMIVKNMDQRLDDLKDSSDIRFILDNKSYASANEFIDALHPNEHEKEALVFLLNQYQSPLIVSDVTPNTVIEMLWDEHGLQLLQEIVHDKKVATDLFSLPDAPSQIISTAYNIKNRNIILKNLPLYHNLPPLAGFADSLARIYRVEGKEKMFIEAKKHPKETKGKAISYGFLLAIGKANDVRWKYEKEEIESGEFLRPYIETLLSCQPESYHDALQDLLTYSGTSIDISKHKK